MKKEKKGKMKKKKRKSEMGESINSEGLIPEDTILDNTMPNNNTSENTMPQMISLSPMDRRKIASKIGILILRARMHAHLSQAELAQKMGTHQPSIARIESGKALPSLLFLFKIARCMHTDFIFPTFGFLEPNAPQNRRI